jgi:hypothetical protein
MMKGVKQKGSLPAILQHLHESVSQLRNFLSPHILKMVWCGRIIAAAWQTQPPLSTSRVVQRPSFAPRLIGPQTRSHFPHL